MMNLKLGILSLLAAASLGAPGCASDPAKAASLPLILTSALAGRTVTAAKGDTLQIRLESNPSTGYSWKFFPDQNYLKPLKKEFISGNSNLSGAPGLEVFSFKVLRPGTTNLTGYYYRPWEKLDIAKDLKVSFTIEIK